jgi:hypothetical protein
MTEAEQERASVVAWLRRDAALLQDDIDAGCWDGKEHEGEWLVEIITDAAAAIERGDHLTK